MAARKKAARPAKKSKPAKRKAAKPAKKVARKPAKKPAKRAPARAAKPASRPKPMEMNAPNGKPAKNAFGLAHHHFDYTSHDVSGVKRFYAELLGFANTIFSEEHGYLNVMVTPTSSIGFMAPMPGLPPESWSPPGEPTLYFFVVDVEKAYADLTARGVSFEQSPQDMPWGHRVATCRDPEGRRVCFAQNLGKQGP